MEKAKKTRAKSVYHLFKVDSDGRLSPLGTHEGRKADDAFESYLDTNGVEAKGADSYVIVPDRNLAHVKPDVQRKVKLISV